MAVARLSLGVGGGALSMQLSRSLPHTSPSSWRWAATDGCRWIHPPATQHYRFLPRPPRGLGSCSRWRRSEEHTSELQSLMRISYAVFWLKTKNIQHTITQRHNITIT